MQTDHYFSISGSFVDVVLPKSGAIAEVRLKGPSAINGFVCIDHGANFLSFFEPLAFCLVGAGVRKSNSNEGSFATIAMISFLDRPRMARLRLISEDCRLRQKTNPFTFVVEEVETLFAVVDQKSDPIPILVEPVIPTFGIRRKVACPGEFAVKIDQILTIGSHDGADGLCIEVEVIKT